jgi:asparagine synthase (glutamine-hydrolysing)
LRGVVILLALALALRALLPHPWFVAERCESLAGAALAAVSLERTGHQSQLAIDQVSGLACVLDGEFYNSRELASSLPRVGRGSASPTDALLLLDGWRQEGATFLKRMNGSFSAVIWDANRRQATVITDRFGNRPLYYSMVNDRLLISSRLKSLTADPDFSLAIDPRGMAQFFTFGHYLGEHTSLGSARIFPAAAAWTWQADTGVWN